MFILILLSLIIINTSVSVHNNCYFLYVSLVVEVLCTRY